MLNRKRLRKEKVMGQSLDSRDSEINCGPTGFSAALQQLCRQCRLVVGGEASVPAERSGPSPSERRHRVGQRPRTGQGIRRLCRDARSRRRRISRCRLDLAYVFLYDT